MAPRQSTKKKSVLPKLLRKPRDRIQKQLIWNVGEQETRIALLEDGRLAEIFIERMDHRQIVGNLYKGRVESIVPGIQAAFVDIGMHKNGFLYVSDVVDTQGYFDDIEIEDVGANSKKPSRNRDASIDEVLREGQEILVQVTKEPIGTKGPRLTSFITFPGRFLVMMPTVSHLGISRKIASDKERDRLKKILYQVRHRGTGYIVRTAAEGKGEKELTADIKFLSSLWNRVRRKSNGAACPSLIHEDLDPTLRIVRDIFTSDIDEVFIDSEEARDTITKFLDRQAVDLTGRVKAYRGRTPIFEKYGIEKDLEKALQKRVWLKSGGYIVIEPTEALVSIDVNTGRYKGKESLEETVLKTNLEAAREIARQLRLRDTGGIIVVDFIDMMEPKNRQELIDEFEKALKSDRSPTTISEITDLGLVEMTRKRVRGDLSSFLCRKCPYCRGTGQTKSVSTLTIETVKGLRRIASRTREKGITVEAHPDVIKKLQTTDLSLIVNLEREFGKTFQLSATPEFHMEEVKFRATRTKREFKRV